MLLIQDHQCGKAKGIFKSKIYDAKAAGGLIIKTILIGYECTKWVIKYLKRDLLRW